MGKRCGLQKRNELNEVFKVDYSSRHYSFDRPPSIGAKDYYFKVFYMRFDAWNLKWEDFGFWVEVLSVGVSGAARDYSHHHHHSI